MIKVSNRDTRMTSTPFSRASAVDFKQVNVCWEKVRLTPFKRQPHKMVKHTQAIRRQQQTNCLSVFDHFLGLALKGLKKLSY